jgi:hypothetical protein
MHWDEARDKLSLEPRRWYYSRLQGGRKGGRSALTAQSMEALVGTNAYADRFFQGATIVPRNFFFIEIDQALRGTGNLRDRVVAIRTADAADREAKRPWKGQLLSGRTEGSLLYRTAIARNIIPFGLVDPPLVVLPVILANEKDKEERFEVLTADGLLENGLRFGSTWFFKAEKCWKKSRTDKNRDMEITLEQYLDWQSKLSEQNPRARYLVLYTSSATDAAAVVIDRRTFDHPFVVDHKAYWCECISEAEAHYVSAYINSGYANEKIKEFQSRGLFGPRDIHKLIVKLPFPKYQKGDSDHEALSALGKTCAKLASNFIKISNIDDLQARALGAIRVRLKDQLAAELGEIDRIVEKLSTGKSAAHRATKKRSRRGSTMGKLFD